MNWRRLTVLGVWLGSVWLTVAGVAGHVLTRRVTPVPPPEPAPVPPPNESAGEPAPAELTDDMLRQALDLLGGAYPSAIEVAGFLLTLGARGATNSRGLNPIALYLAALFNLEHASDIPEWHAGASAQGGGDLVEVGDGLVVIVTGDGARVSSPLPPSVRDFLARYDAGEFPSLVDPELQEIQQTLAAQIKGMGRAPEEP